MFLFAFWVSSTPKCEAVNLPKFELACIHTRPLRYLDIPILLFACVPCTCMCDVDAQCDVTRFAYDASHITMTSPAFTSHSCHVDVGMRWHDVIGVHIA